MKAKSKDSHVRLEDKVTQPKTNSIAEVSQSIYTKDQNLTCSQNSQDQQDFMSVRDEKPVELQEENKAKFVKSITQKFE